MKNSGNSGPLHGTHESNLFDTTKAYAEFNSVAQNLIDGKDFKAIWENLLNEGHFNSILSSFAVLLEQNKVAHYRSAVERMSSPEYQLQDEGQSLSATMQALQKYIHEAVNTQSPYFLNQLYGGAHPVAVISEFVAAFMNTSMATYEIAPVATVMEQQVLEALRALTHWSQIDGLFVPGGSYANMMALHVARYNKQPDVKSFGHHSKLSVYVSDQAHYSVLKAAHLLGYGENAVKIIASDRKHKMSVAALEKQILSDLAAGEKPCVVVSTLGTTVFGALDPVDEVQKLAQKYGLWHHVDAAWGGPLVFLDEAWQKALSDVDSVTYDFHKFFAAGVTKALFVTSHVQLLQGSNSCAGTEYIFHDGDEVVGMESDALLDTGMKALQCGRKVEALTLWTLWKFLGLNGMRQMISDFLSLQKLAVEQVQFRGFKLLHEPEYLNICFKLPIHQDSDEWHLKIRQALIQQGQLYINYSKDSRNGVYFRLVLSHLRLNEATLNDVFDKIESTWEEITKRES